jgi:hypothetical protein
LPAGERSPCIGTRERHGSEAAAIGISFRLHERRIPQLA